VKIKLKNFIFENYISLIFILAAIFVCVIWRVSPLRFIAYHDIKVLVILLTMMLLSAGLEESGVLSWLAIGTIKVVPSRRMQAWGFVLLSALFSAFAVNDIAILTLVPLVFKVFDESGYTPVYPLVLITLSANLVGAIFPISNPQNMYLYAYYGISGIDFIKATIPIVTFSLILITLLVFLLIPDEQVKLDVLQVRVKWWGILYGALLVSTVVFILWGYDTALFVILGIALLLSFIYRRVWLYVDYMLLFTFIAFFIVSGFITSHMTIHLNSAIKVYMVSAFLSQFISNVPAATIIADMTRLWKPLLYGVTVGGTGTIIASMANFITYRLYKRRRGKTDFMSTFHKIAIPLFFIMLIWGWLLLSV